MKRKIISVVVAISLLLFSFYYTSKSIEFVKDIDPIKKNIEKNKSKFEIKYKNATIEGNTIIPGISGKKINIDESYKKMKQYGAYNETLIKVEDNKPEITIDDNYDKYIIHGNKIKKEVSIIIKIRNINELNIIDEYIKKNNIKVTLLLDQSLLEEQYLTNISSNIELMYDKKTDVEVSSTKNYLYSITNKKNNFCIIEDTDEKILNICKNNKMHTVIPNIILKTNVVKNLRNKLDNGSIILIELNIESKDMLDYMIKYINSKGYKIEYLNSLLNE